jgi:hypothetical protein
MAAQKTKKLSPENEKTLLKIRALLATASGPASDYSIIEWLYKSLNVLDGKANGLLRFDSVIITIITIVLNRVISVGKSPQYEVYSLVTSLILLGASCFFLFQCD